MESTKDKNIDILDRKEWVDRVVNIIDSLPLESNGGSFAINGKWGCGKTFVVDVLIKELEVKNNYIVIKYNAWENDYYDEPLVAILACLVEKINELTTCERLFKSIGKDILGVMKEILEDIAGALAVKFIGVNPLEHIRRIKIKLKEKNQESKIKDSFDTNLIFKQSIKLIQEQLAKLTTKFRVVIIVDELDRCLPDYSIKVLERLHHLFDEQLNLLQVISIDKDQLEHSIKTIFGAKVDIEKYLAKFIKFSIRLAEGEFNEKFKERFDRLLALYSVPDKYKDVNIMLIVKACLDGLPIRESIQALDRIELIHKLVWGKEKWDVSLFCFELIHCIYDWFDLDSVELSYDEVKNEDHYNDIKYAYDYEEYRILVKYKLMALFKNIKYDKIEGQVLFNRVINRIQINTEVNGDIGLINLLAILFFNTSIFVPMEVFDKYGEFELKIFGNSADELLPKCKEYIKAYRMIESRVTFKNSNLYNKINKKQ